MGTRLRFVGVEDPGAADLTIRVEAHDDEGPVARLESSDLLANRAGLQRRLGYATLPEVLHAVVPE